MTSVEDVIAQFDACVSLNATNIIQEYLGNGSILIKLHEITMSKFSSCTPPMTVSVRHGDWICWTCSFDNAPNSVQVVQLYMNLCCSPMIQIATRACGQLPIPPLQKTSARNSILSALPEIKDSKFMKVRCLDYVCGEGAQSFEISQMLDIGYQIFNSSARFAKHKTWTVIDAQSAFENVPWHEV